jgi:hypothetical protein
MSSSGHKKPKLVRDSFTIPKTEYAAIDALKTRAIAMGTSVKKSELLRAGLMVLQSLSDAGYKRALSDVPTLKTGRPPADKTPSAKKGAPNAEATVSEAKRPAPRAKKAPPAQTAKRAPGTARKVSAKRASAKS